MNICIVSPFNHFSLHDFYDDYSKKLDFDSGVASSSVNALALGLLRLGHKLIVITISSKVTSQVVLRGKQVEVYIVPFGASAWWRRFIVNSFIQIRDIRKIIYQNINFIDVIHSHWTYNYAYAVLPFAHIKPTFCTVRDWYPYLESNMPIRQRRSSFEMLRKYYFNRVINNGYIRLVANSVYVKSCLHDWFGKRDFPYIPNSVRQEFILEGEHEKPPYPRFISIQQSLDEGRKNIITLIDAFRIVHKEIPHATLTLVGTFDENGDVFQYARCNGLLDCIEFVGAVPHLIVMTLLDQSSVLVHPAVEETFGNIFIEAFARKVPVIGGQTSGAVPQVLGYGKFGRLCDVNSSDQLSRVMIDAITDIEATQKQVLASHKELIDKYSEESVANQYIELYKCHRTCV